MYFEYIWEKHYLGNYLFAFRTFISKAEILQVGIFSSSLYLQKKSYQKKFEIEETKTT